MARRSAIALAERETTGACGQILTDDVDPLENTPPRRRWRMRVSLVAGSLAAVALAGLWVQRKPIAEGFVDRELASRGVEARYRIERLGLGRQRLVDVVIGDPRNPDLIAKSVEIELDIGLTGASVRAIDARGVRVRGRVIDGRLSLGQIDRLLPPPSGKPFALPQLFVRLSDARMRLETPAGVVGLTVEGSGGLNDGFDGRVAAISRTLGAGGCVVSDPSAYLEIEIEDAQPRLRGPVRAARIACAEASSGALTVDVDAALSEALDSVRGRAKVAVGNVRSAEATAARIAGTVEGAASAKAVNGTVDLIASEVRSANLNAASARFAGAVSSGSGFGVDGEATLAGASVPTALLTPLSQRADGLAGTPVGPIAGALATAATRAAGRFDARSDVDFRAGRLTLGSLRARSASGARLTVAGDDALVVDARGVGIDGQAALAGGGFPSMRVALSRSPAGALTGRAAIAPMAAGNSRLALGPVQFSATPRGNTRVRTLVELSGPIGDGRVDRLRVSVDALIGGDGGLAVNPDCTVASLNRLTISGLTLDPTRARLCPTGPALVTVRRGVLGGGARIAAPAISGRIGSTPLRLAAGGASVDLSRTGFAISGLAARIGAEDRQTRLDFSGFEGRSRDGGLAGRFTGASGQIANVPLLLSDGDGSWSLRGGALAAQASAIVSDAAPDPRFQPMRVPDLALALVDNRITATGRLTEPNSGTKVADVDIVHDLARGAGRAVLDVPGITFGPSLQPEALTRLTLGVVANVRGTVSGRGDIAWDAEGVRSTGVFRTTATDLAAAFGPVTGISTEVRFSDLLGLVSEPGQTATIAGINPGVAVENGVVRYRLLEGQRVQVEGGRWPFAGGELILEPTTLDFAEQAERRLTFKVIGLDAAQFIQKMEFENIAATGVFDGTLPMIFDENGGRISGGRLVVRPGGGTLSYVGEVTNAQLGTWGKLAFDALKSIKYDRLTIELDGAIDGEIVSQIRFDGINDGPASEADNSVIKGLKGLPFRFNITIKAPFRGLIGTARSFTDPSELIRSQLPTGLSPVDPSTKTTVQPQESENRP